MKLHIYCQPIIILYKLFI